MLLLIINLRKVFETQSRKFAVRYFVLTLWYCFYQLLDDNGLGRKWFSAKVDGNFSSHWCVEKVDLNCHTSCMCASALQNHRNASELNRNSEPKTLLSCILVGNSRVLSGFQLQIRIVWLWCTASASCVFSHYARACACMACMEL